MSLRRSLTARVTLLGGVALMCLWSFFPIYWMIVSSLRPERDLFAPPTLIPTSFDTGFKAYWTLLELTDYPLQFLNSVMVAGAVVVITLLVSVVIAYVVTRYRIPGKTIIVARPTSSSAACSTHICSRQCCSPFLCCRFLPAWDWPTVCGR